MEGRDVVTSDDQKLGTVLAERGEFVILETGHVFKSKHAIPSEFLHDQGDAMIATVTRDVVMDSPKVEVEDFDAGEIRRHYGLDVAFQVDPDPEEPQGARETGTEELALERPVVRDRQPNAADPAGNTANMTDRNRTGGKR